MSDDEEEFENAGALKVWLESKGVPERKAAEAAPVLFNKGFDNPDALNGISPDVLHRNGLSGATAQTLSNRLAKRQQQVGEWKETAAANGVVLKKRGLEGQRGHERALWNVECHWRRSQISATCIHREPPRRAASS